MIEWLTKDELERIWKGEVITWSWYETGTCGRPRKPQSRQLVSLSKFEPSTPKLYS
jgi:hypothetical protein